MKGQTRLLTIFVGAFLLGLGLAVWKSFVMEYLAIAGFLISGAVAGAMLVQHWSKIRRNPLTDRLVRRNLQEDLRQSEERLKLVIEGTNDGIWDWDIANNKVFWSERAHALSGQGSQGFGDSWDIFKQKVVKEDLERFEKALRGHLVNDAPFNLELRLLNPRGEKTRYIQMRGKAKRNEQGNPERMAGSVSDVTIRKTAEQELFHNAYHDALTDLGNRRLFMDRLEHHIQRTTRRPDFLFSIIVIDIDKFKIINDSFGHGAGDRVLREIATRIEERCHRFEDRVVARIGGDVFGIVLGDVRHPEKVRDLAVLIEQDLQSPFLIDGRQVGVSASLGIVFNGEKVENTEEMLANADTVLQVAKKRPYDGRSRAEVFDSPMRKKAQELYRLEQELRKAVELEQFRLVYQPIVNIHNNQVEGFEALVRWAKEEGTEIQPADFIPMAEDTGLILPMGNWILRTACQQAKEWVEAGFPDITVAVNFSARQFINQDLASQVSKVLSDVGLNSRNLKIEITESTAMHEMERTIETLTHLSGMGLQISIDDFGTGYSSLSYLKRYPIDTLKIDRSFVKDIPSDIEDMAITRTIISMANNLHLKIIAEGVETSEQLEFLRQEGCQQVQGFYFSKPLGKDDALAFMRKHAAA